MSDTSLQGTGLQGTGLQGAGSVGAAKPWVASYPLAVDAATPIVAKPVYALLDDTAALYPANDCVDFLDKHYSYAEIKRESDKVAKGLQRMGLKPACALACSCPIVPISSSSITAP